MTFAYFDPQLLFFAIGVSLLGLTTEKPDMLGVFKKFLVWSPNWQHIFPVVGHILSAQFEDSSLIFSTRMYPL
jgi:hypothetical protein